MTKKYLDNSGLEIVWSKTKSKITTEINKVNGSNIVLTNYTISEDESPNLSILPTDTVNKAIGKLEKSIIDNEFVISDAFTKLKQSIGLDDSLIYTAPDGNYINSSTSIINALTILDAALNSHETNNNIHIPSGSSSDANKVLTFNGTNPVWGTPSEGLSDAPADSNLYARKNNSWIKTDGLVTGTKSVIFNDASNVASGSYSAVFGQTSKALKNYSIAGGKSNLAFGNNSIAIGSSTSSIPSSITSSSSKSTVSSAYDSTKFNVAYGENSVAIGKDNFVGGDNSFIYGATNKASGDATNIIGESNTTDDNVTGVTILGNSNKLSGTSTSCFVANDSNNMISIKNSTILGLSNTILGDSSGSSIIPDIFILGNQNILTDVNSGTGPFILIGNSNTLNKPNSIAIGISNQAGSNSSPILIGDTNYSSIGISNGICLGTKNATISDNNISIGNNNGVSIKNTSGSTSDKGTEIVAIGDHLSIPNVFGKGLSVTGNGTHNTTYDMSGLTILGRYNANYYITDDSFSTNADKAPILIVGNGVPPKLPAEPVYSNALVLERSGRLWLADGLISNGNITNSGTITTDGKITVNSETATSLIKGNLTVKGKINGTLADYAEMFEWADGNPDNEDRTGYFVTLVNDKIAKADSSSSYILGTVSPCPAIVANSPSEWQGKYKKDEWGRTIFETNDKGEKVPVVSEEYNPEQEYIPRDQRKEWSAIGMTGQLRIRQDGTLVAGGYCRPNDDGIGTSSSDGFYVMKIISEDKALILVK